MTKRAGLHKFGRHLTPSRNGAEMLGKGQDTKGDSPSTHRDHAVTPPTPTRRERLVLAVASPTLPSLPAISDGHLPC
jgi:hypothetical protein